MTTVMLSFLFLYIMNKDRIFIRSTCHMEDRSCDSFTKIYVKWHTSWFKKNFILHDGMKYTHQLILHADDHALNE